MSKTVTIPTDGGNPFVVILGGVKYVYKPGETVEVPDGVALEIEEWERWHEKHYGENEPPFGEEWELIAEGEVGENVTSVEITADSDENALNLKKAVVYAILYTHTENKSKWVAFYSGDLVVSLGAVTNIYIDNKAAMKAEAYITPYGTLEGRLVSQINVAITSNHNLSSSLTENISSFATNSASGLGALLHKTTNKGIDKIVMDANIKAGSAYKIYGVRA